MLLGSEEVVPNITIFGTNSRNGLWPSVRDDRRTLMMTGHIFKYVKEKTS
jgi:hypothetical protein